MDMGGQNEKVSANCILSPAEEFMTERPTLLGLPNLSELPVPENALRIRCQLNPALYQRGQMQSLMPQTTGTNWIQHNPQTGVTKTTLELLTRDSGPVVVGNVGTLFENGNLSYYQSKQAEREVYLEALCDFIKTEAQSSLYILSLGIELSPEAENPLQLIKAALGDLKQEKQHIALVGYTTKLNVYQAFAKPLPKRAAIELLLPKKSARPIAEAPGGQTQARKQVPRKTLGT